MIQAPCKNNFITTDFSLVRDPDSRTEAIVIPTGVKSPEFRESAGIEFFRKFKSNTFRIILT